MRTNERTNERTNATGVPLICPRCAAQDCRVSVVKRKLPVNVKVTTTTWCRVCWWQDEKSENIPPAEAEKIQGALVADGD